MESTYEILKYADATDRCLGIAGMAVGIFVFDGQQYIYAVDPSQSDMEVIEFTPDFSTPANVSVSAKAVWHSMAERYRIMAAMALANLLARTVAGTRRAIDPPTLSAVIELLDTEADNLLSLSHEENRDLCLQTYDHLRRVFSHPTVRQITVHLSERISQGTPIERGELMEFLSPLM